MIPQPKQFYTLAEYFTLERESEIKYEYWDGEVFAMSGASPEHEQIVVNLTLEIGSQLRTHNCRLFSSNLRVKVPIAPPYKYPDLTALCEKPEYEVINGLKALVNPALIVEVLSSTTAVFDQGDKFTAYKSIPNFKEYLLIAQDKPHVILFVKQSENQWLQSEYLDVQDVFRLTSIDCALSLQEIYRNVEFNPVTRLYLQPSNAEKSE